MKNIDFFFDFIWIFKANNRNKIGEIKYWCQKLSSKLEYLLLNICRIYFLKAIFSLKIDDYYHKTHKNTSDGAAISAQEPQDKF